MVPTHPAIVPSFLIIDDNHDLRAFLQLLLVTEGYQVRTAASLDEALDALDERLPDLVIAELRLSSSPPLAVLDLLEADERRRLLPLLVCTGAIRDAEVHATRLERYGAVVVQKPFDIDEFLAIVRKLSTRSSLGKHQSSTCLGA